MGYERLLKIGGEDFDLAIAGLVRHNKDFLIGRAYSGEAAPGIRDL